MVLQLCHSCTRRRLRFVASKGCWKNFGCTVRFLCPKDERARPHHRETSGRMQGDIFFVVRRWKRNHTSLLLSSEWTILNKREPVYHTNCTCIRECGRPNDDDRLFFTHNGDSYGYFLNTTCIGCIAYYHLPHIFSHSPSSRLSITICPSCTYSSPPHVAHWT